MTKSTLLTGLLLAAAPALFLNAQAPAGDSGMTIGGHVYGDFSSRMVHTTDAGFNQYFAFVYGADAKDAHKPTYGVGLSAGYAVSPDFDLGLFFRLNFNSKDRRVGGFTINNKNRMDIGATASYNMSDDCSLYGFAAYQMDKVTTATSQVVGEYDFHVTSDLITITTGADDSAGIMGAMNPSAESDQKQFEFGMGSEMALPVGDESIDVSVSVEGGVSMASQLESALHTLVKAAGDANSDYAFAAYEYSHISLRVILSASTKF